LDEHTCSKTAFGHQQIIADNLPEVLGNYLCAWSAGSEQLPVRFRDSFWTKSEGDVLVITG
jgi:hypothetical protein